MPRDPRVKDGPGPKGSLVASLHKNAFRTKTNQSTDGCVSGGHGASKSSRDPKTVDNSPRQRPEMTEITSFDDAAIVVYRGFTGHRNPPGTRKSWTIAHENGQK